MNQHTFLSGLARNRGLEPHLPPIRQLGNKALAFLVCKWRKSEGYLTPPTKTKEVSIQNTQP